MSLFRGAEYSQLVAATKREALTFYDMNLSAQDHQTFFTCEADGGKEDMEGKIMQFELFFLNKDNFFNIKFYQH